MTRGARPDRRHGEVRLDYLMTVPLPVLGCDVFQRLVRCHCLRIKSAGVGPVAAGGGASADAGAVAKALAVGVVIVTEERTEELVLDPILPEWPVKHNLLGSFGSFKTCGSFIVVLLRRVIFFCDAPRGVAKRCNFFATRCIF